MRRSTGSAGRGTGTPRGRSRGRGTTNDSRLDQRLLPFVVDYNNDKGVQSF